MTTSKTIKKYQKEFGFFEVNAGYYTNYYSMLLDELKNSRWRTGRNEFSRIGGAGRIQDDGTTLVTVYAPLWALAMLVDGLLDYSLFFVPMNQYGDKIDWEKRVKNIKNN